MGYLQKWGSELSKLNPVKTAQTSAPDTAAMDESQKKRDDEVRAMLEAEKAKAPVTAQTVNASTVAAPAAVQAGSVSGSQAEQDYKNAIAGNQINRSDIRNISGGGNVERAAVSTQQADAARNAQMQLLNQLIDPVTGQPVVSNTPESIALQRNTERAMAQQVGAAQMGGSNPALAARQATMNMSQISSEANAQQSMLQAAQRQQAIQQAAGITSDIRGTDLATQQLALEAQKTNIQAQEAAKGRQLEAEIRNAGYDFETLQRNAAAGDAAAAQLLQNFTADVDRKFNADTFNVQQTSDILKFNAKQQQEAELVNADNQLKARGMDDASRQALIAQLAGLNAEQMKYELAKYGVQTQVDTANAAAKNAMAGAVMGAVSGGAAAFVKAKSGGA